ncbi:hypothetical protein C5167_008138, partial [Papaver somniferum]
VQLTLEMRDVRVVGNDLDGNPAIGEWYFLIQKICIQIDDEVRLEDDWVPMDEQLGAAELEEVIRKKEAHSSVVVLESGSFKYVTGVIFVVDALERYTLLSSHPVHKTNKPGILFVGILKCNISLFELPLSDLKPSEATSYSKCADSSSSNTPSNIRRDYGEAFWLCETLLMFSLIACYVSVRGEKAMQLVESGLKEVIGVEMFLACCSKFSFTLCAYYLRSFLVLIFAYCAHILGNEHPSTHICFVTKTINVG